MTDAPESCSRAYLEKLIRDHTDTAIVEAEAFGFLKVRVPSSCVDAVRVHLHEHFPISYSVSVFPLGFVEAFVRGVHIFA